MTLKPHEWSDLMDDYLQRVEGWKKDNSPPFHVALIEAVSALIDERKKLTFVELKEHDRAIYLDGCISVLLNSVPACLPGEDESERG